MERFAAIDFETANGKRSSICSIGIAIIEDNKVVDSVYTLVRPYPNFYTRFTTAVHGITMQDTIDSPDFEEAWAGIAGKLRDIPLIAHNSPFDEGCLRAAHEAYDLAYQCGFDLTYHHHAMADAYACAHIAATMMREKGVERLCEL